MRDNKRGTIEDPTGALSARSAARLSDVQTAEAQCPVEDDLYSVRCELRPAENDPQYGENTAACVQAIKLLGPVLWRIPEDDFRFLGGQLGVLFRNIGAARGFELD